MRKSKFITLATNFEKLLLKEEAEQQLPPDAAMPPPDDMEDENAPPVPQESAPTQPAQPAAQALSPEGEVTLVRLLKQAFVARPKDDDALRIENLGDVTSANAKEQLKAISEMLSTYTEIKV